VAGRPPYCPSSNASKRTARRRRASSRRGWARICTVAISSNAERYLVVPADQVVCRLKSGDAERRGRQLATTSQRERDRTAERDRHQQRRGSPADELAQPEPRDPLRLWDRPQNQRDGSEHQRHGETDQAVRDPQQQPQPVSHNAVRPTVVALLASVSGPTNQSVARVSTETARRCPRCPEQEWTRSGESPRGLAQAIPALRWRQAADRQSQQEIPAPIQPVSRERFLTRSACDSA
jgi:hypothetical protein